MTAEEAIWYLTPIANSTSLVRYKEALGLAIDALRAQQEERWVSVQDGLPENASQLGALCPRYMVSTKLGVTEGWYNPDLEAWYVLFWFMTDRILASEIDFERADVPRIVKVDTDAGFVTHWMPMPKQVKDEKHEIFPIPEPPEEVAR